MILPMRRLLLLLVIAVALAAPAAAGAVERTVSVSATVERQVSNDTAEVHFSVSKERTGRAGVFVITHSPEAAGDLVAAGVAAGATSTRGPRFFVADRETAYNAALVEALERAKAKAGLLAAAAGATLGPAITIVEGGGVTPVSGMRGAASPKGEEVAAPPVKPGKSTVEATVAATFALE
jgi:uncharacterized protein YggE